MTTWLTRLRIGACLLALLGASSCEKNDPKIVATPSGQPTLTATGTSNQVLLQTNSTSSAITYTWTPVTFGFQSTTVQYNLQFDKAGNNFANPQTVAAGAALTKTLTVSDLNSIYQSLGLVATSGGQKASTLDVRVVANIGTPSGATSASTTSSLIATPYNYCAQPSKAWDLIGPAGKGWTMDIVMVYDCASNTYSYTGPLNADDFKFRFNSDWTANYGGASSTGGSLTQDGPNLHISTAGTYTIVLSPGTIDSSTGKASSGSFTIK